MFTNLNFLLLTFLYFLSIVIFLITNLIPPKKINSVYGYRTALSMKNMDNWNFANSLAPKVMIAALLIGYLFFFITFLIFKEYFTSDKCMFFCMLYFVLNTTAVIFIMEKKLQTFDKSNKVKSQID